jgi:2-phospho-L-lactate guanylyltransferase
MRTAAILPIKSFSEAKRRLQHELDADDRRVLVEAMFSDVLVALGRVPDLERIVVVSGDRVAQAIGEAYGARIVDDDERGHNTAAMRGIEAALEAGLERVLLVPGDCPLLSPEDISSLLVRPSGEREAVIVPDRHGTGTNALLLTPPDSLAPSFGPDSRRRHYEDARTTGVSAEVVELESLALDVDTPDDLEALQRRLEATHGGAAHTRGMLNRLLRARS